MHASESMTRALSYAGQALALLLAINLFNYIDRYVVAAVEPLIAREFFPQGVPGEGLRMGLLMYAFMVAYMLAAPVCGWLADRWPRWWIVGGAVIGWSLASLGSGLAGTFGVLMLTRVLVGIGEAAYGPTAPALIADLYPVRTRGRVMAWFYLAIPVGSALGYLAGGLIAAAFSSWRWPFYLVAVPGLLLGLLCFAMREPRRGEADRATLSLGSGNGAGEQAGPAPGAWNTRTVRLRDLPVLLRTPSFVLNTLGMTAMTFAMGGMAFWMPRYVAVYRLGAAVDTPEGAAVLAHVNMVFGAITVAAGIAGTLAGGWLGDRLRGRVPGAYFVVSALAMFLGFPLVLAIFIAPFPAAWILVFAAEFCLFFNTGPTNTIVANVVHPAMRASAFALTILVIHLLGDAISPAIMGYVADRTGGNWDAAFALVAGAFLLAAGLWLVGAKFLERDTEAAPNRLP